MQFICKNPVLATKSSFLTTKFNFPASKSSIQSRKPAFLIHFSLTK
nr:MAG TPA: hypothetical protein [Caudoviricetes sp.]